MNRNTACFLLDISPDDIYDPCTGKMDRDRLRRQYRIQSLRLHPDKNPAPDAVEQFQRMNDAYIWLSETSRSETGKSETDRSETSMGMGNKNEMGTETRTETMTTLWTWFQDGCQERLAQWIQRQDKETLFRLHTILSMPSFLPANERKIHTDFAREDPSAYSTGRRPGGYDQVRGALQHIQSLLASSLKTKCSRDQRRVLRPTLSDVLSDQVFRLVVEDQTYWIPLWVDELVYDLGDRELVVQCIPTLPSNVVVDERHKHIYVHCVWSIAKDIWGKQEMDVVIDTRPTPDPADQSDSDNLPCVPLPPSATSSIRYSVRISQLRITSHPQKILLSTRGIPCTISDHIYDVSRRGSIFACITLVP